MRSGSVDQVAGRRLVRAPLATSTIQRVRRLSWRAIRLAVRRPDRRVEERRRADRARSVEPGARARRRGEMESRTRRTGRRARRGSRRRATRPDRGRRRRSVRVRLRIVPLLGRHGEDVAARREDGARPRGRAPAAWMLSPDVDPVRPDAEQVGAQLDLDPPELRRSRGRRGCSAPNCSMAIACRPPPADLRSNPSVAKARRRTVRARVS